MQVSRCYVRRTKALIACFLIANLVNHLCVHAGKHTERCVRIIKTGSYVLPQHFQLYCFNACGAYMQHFKFVIINNNPFPLAGYGFVAGNDITR